MSDEKKEDRYFVLKENAVPEVLLKVVEVKKKLARDKSISIKDAVIQVGISRSTFYRYKDDISPLRREMKGKTINFTIQLEDKPGYLSVVLKTIADHQGNILTIHQSIPIHGVALLTFSVKILSDLNNVEEMFEEIEKQEGVYEVRLLGEG